MTAVSTQQTSHYLRRGAIVMLLCVAGGFAVDYCLNLLLSRLLDPTEFGDFKVAYSFGFLASVVVVLGGDRAAPSLLSADLAKDDNRAVWEFLRFFGLIALGLSTVLIFLVTLASVLHVGSFDLGRHHAVVHISVVVPFIAFGALLARVLQAGKFLGAATASWRIAFPLLQVVLLAALAGVVEPLRVDHAVAAASLSVLLLCGWLWGRARRLALIEVRRRPDLFDTGKALRTAVPMMAVMLLALGLAQTDIFMLEWLGDEHHVGHFAAAASSAHWVFLAQATIMGVFAPLIAPAIAAGAETASRTFWQAQRAVTAATVLLVVLLGVGAPLLLSLFGPDYEHAVSALRLLTLAYATSCLAAPAASWLQYSGRGRAALIAALGALIVDAGANYYAIPRYGVDGAAAATLAAMSVSGVGVSVAILRHGLLPISAGRPR